MAGDSHADPAIDITIMPGHMANLKPVTLGQMGSFIPTDEISPAPQAVEELPVDELWVPGVSESELPEFVEVPQDDDSVDMPTPVTMTKLKPIEDLTDQQFGQVCKAIEILYEEEDPETLTAGDCAYEYASQAINITDIEVLSCDRRVDNCVTNREDNIEEAAAPIGLCDGAHQAPNNCEINFAQVQSCLNLLKDSQAALAEEDICDVTVETVTHTRTLLNNHRKSLACLQKLEANCPAIALTDSE
jgi:hypothetical protein